MFDGILLQLRQLDSINLVVFAVAAGLFVFAAIYHNSKNPESGNVPTIFIAVVGFISVSCIVLLLT